MRHITLLFLIGIALSFCSCRSDFETVASTGDLTFSKDTVYLDTVFTNLSSSTYTLKVYNHSKNDISIPTIKFNKGLSSKYRMSVDGAQGNQGKMFENVTLLAKDSLYIFIETTVESNVTNPTEFLYTDQIEFDAGANLQKVELVTLVQDAILLYPNRNADGTTETLPIGNEKINGFYLDKNDPIHGNELLFTNKKPYVIYGYAAVPEGETVTFDPGARVYFHSDSGLIVPKNASIHINGTTSTTDKLENEVLFGSDRLQPDFAYVPGQWGTVWLQNGSTNNKIQNLTLKNATVGLLIDNNDGTTVSIKNTQIYNCTHYGIQAKNALIEGENVAINYAGQASLACTYGGNYKFTHCTFNNNWSSPEQVALFISNNSAGATPETKDLTAATFNNCIIYGSYSNEMLLSKKTGAAFEYQFNNCLIKSNNTKDPNYQFDTDPVHYNAIITNKDPKFLNANLNNFNIDNTSSAFAKGNPAYLIPLDILGITRTLPPDLGAYQNKPFPKTK
ncbi:right-handed parallel beta-helix repeat-containing protein [Flavobacterium aestivum]|uniref:right-handed parallel beta-helix repeat-containing protein n=1 Tax=Flavobacterium aestivum TaxID=3003257 RepID=UPI002482E7C5|nr:right-handed parallel beta-helix repeat-containing protein [Flavobacterium aestivum]